MNSVENPKKINVGQDQVLDLSYNQILQLNDTTFKRYFRLKKLIFSHNGYPLEGSPHTEMVFYTDYCFAVISNLEELDLSNTYFGSIVTMVWPSNLKVLKINDGFHELLNFSDLVYLREVRAVRNRLKHLPDFHFLSPLSILDLSHNKLGVFTPDKISPFCLLSYFAFELTDDFGLKENYCSCNYLKKWLDMINIRGTPAIGCYDDSVRDYNCMQNFDYLWNDYYQCLGRHPLGFMKPVVVCFAVFSIITISILVVIFITKTQGDEEYSDEEEFEEEDD